MPFLILIPVFLLLAVLVVFAAVTMPSSAK